MEKFFTYNPKWHDTIGNIYSLLEKIKIFDKDNKDVLYLRKSNRILSVSSTTAIEGNALTVQQVFDIINGKVVFASTRDIQEVKNAYSAYEEIPNYNPYRIEDFLKAHKLITSNLIKDAGKFRNFAVVVINKTQEIIHRGADFKEIPILISELFDWAKDTDVHDLIKSSLVHFMIEHIHPFIDGNGRIGRLWQTLILAKWNKIFECLPIETMIYYNQEKYYSAILDSQKKEETLNCQPFINFMLDAIEKTLLEYVENQKTQSNGGLFGGLFGGLNILEKDIVSLIKEKPNIRIFEIAQILLKPVRTIENNISRLKEKGVLKRIGSKKTGYWEVLKF